MKYLRTALFIISLSLLLAPVNEVNAQNSKIVNPENYFGYKPGSDGNLFFYKDLIAYLHDLEKGSSRIKLEEIGTSPLGRKMYIAFISSEENISKLQDYKVINMELALNADLKEAQRKQYINEGKVFLLSTKSKTCIWKNVIGFLTEAASARTASPVFVEPNELSVGGKGLSEYKKSINMLLPWEGGWWRLGDIVDYEITSTESILKTASLYREDILQFRNDICREMVETGKTEAPFYYIFPNSQHDVGELVNMVALLKEHGVEVYKLGKDMIIEDIAYHSGGGPIGSTLQGIYQRSSRNSGVS
jgi:hypothetical protein